MIPRILYCLVTLCLVSSITALQSQVRKDNPTIGFLNLDEQEYVEFNPDEEYMEIELPLSNRGLESGPQRPCRQLAVRKEWRDLGASNKQDYIKAVKCLQSTRALDRTLPRNFHRYDEFTYSHSNVAEGIHGVGQFLPWHRHFGYLYEKALRECSYRGPFPYWDWTRDTSGSIPIEQSPLFDPVTGFGGDGVPGTYTQPPDDDGALFPLILGAMKGCVQTGPFVNTIFHVGPNRRLTDHCLNRNFGEFARPVLSPAFIANIESQPIYDDFWNALDGQPFKPDLRTHDGGHAFVGGDMASFYTSPNDPIFFLHHAGLDRLWWKWQKADLPNRLYQIGGRVNISPPYGQVTLDYQLPYDIVGPNVRLRNTMDPRLEPYCYTY